MLERVHSPRRKRQPDARQSRWLLNYYQQNHLRRFRLSSADST
ncbi:hypothetical protein AHF37_09179 [Paragonimus kellicotti]|nr:hypothetical protein AHF37_09179 [Paragonimus kellicotti]